MNELKLYHYWRSSSSWRVRLALAHKKLSAEFIHVSLLNGEAESPSHRARNPLGYVPVLEVTHENKTHLLFESLSILEWLEETYPTPSHLPKDSFTRARARSLSEIINSEIQPLHNLSVLNEVSGEAEAKKHWAQHWIAQGLNAYELSLKNFSGLYSIGDELTNADFCLVPQCYAAERFEVDLKQYPKLYQIYLNLQKTGVYALTHPDRFKPADFSGP